MKREHERTTRGRTVYGELFREGRTELNNNLCVVWVNID